VRGVRHLLLREELPRLGAGGSAVPIVQVHCRHDCGSEKNSPLARRPEG
jgi:hypothetical protein